MESPLTERPSRIRRPPPGLSEYDTGREEPETHPPAPTSEGELPAERSPKKRKVKEAPPPIHHSPPPSPQPQAEDSNTGEPRAEACNDREEVDGVREDSGEHSRESEEDDEFSPILQLPADILAKVLGALPSNLLIQASGACKAFADASEIVFERHCRAKRWLPPRRPRGKAAETKFFPWRSLFRQHACQGCGNPGEFPVRFMLPARVQEVQAFLVCRRCAISRRERLAASDMCIDLVSLTGKPLLKPKAGKFKRRQPLY